MVNDQTVIVNKLEFLYPFVGALTSRYPVNYERIYRPSITVYSLHPFRRPTRPFVLMPLKARNVLTFVDVEFLYLYVYLLLSVECT